MRVFPAARRVASATGEEEGGGGDDFHTSFVAHKGNAEAGDNNAEGASTMIKIEPFLKRLVFAPRQTVQSLLDFSPRRGYPGPPYLPNPSLEEAFVREVAGRKYSHVSIHECLDLGIDPNAPNPNESNMRPLHYASNRGDLRLLKTLLLSPGINVHNADGLGRTPLFFASRGKRSKHTKAARRILENGCDVNAVDRGGGIALREAILASNPATVRLLLKYGSLTTWDEGGESKKRDANALKLARRVQKDAAQSSSQRRCTLCRRRSRAEKVLRLMEDHMSTSMTTCF